MTDLSRTAAPALVADIMDSEPAVAWDAYAVWRDRVHKVQRVEQRALAPPQGWDPYFVWLSRVKKNVEP